MAGCDISVQKRVLLVLAGLSVFVVFLLFIILDIGVTGNGNHFIRKQQDSAIQQFEHSVWNQHLTNDIDYNGGRLLTEDNVEILKPLSVEHCQSQSFLVYKCDSSSYCGGWADRQKGIVSSFLLALLTNRTFIVDMTSPCKLKSFLLPNIYNWSMCTAFLETVSKKNFSYFKYVYGNTRKKFVNQIKSFNFDKNWTKRVVILRFNANTINGIRQHKQAKTRLKWLMNVTNAEAMHLVLHTLFKPNQRILKDAVQFYDNRILGRHLVCSHIRIGKNPSIPADNTRARKPNETVIFEFLDRYDDDRKHAIYIASDSDDIKRHAEIRFKSFVNINRTIVHIDRLGKLRPFTKEACEGFYSVLFEQLILTLCDTLVLTPSGFGSTAAYLRGVSDNLYMFQPETQRILKLNVTF
ncbi:uncharacterized protein LOC123538540 [Mercenaria mercenaria]|uniref:uncharacterized protein LOC123538540 n=1 Tax=Mercenaria mercenaria TaxID=6596 RepID=UPI00234EEE15|nr:uncharacterized protein LOC123538540 [Mercenaria mercenaria]